VALKAIRSAIEADGVALGGVALSE
jgi:hypothetical protein